ncbi:MAG: hypothetical protein JNK48_25440 [Bryobacterales bacterium]|nr:hypothetical protein [Bryobacterales bacterium]
MSFARIFHSDQINDHNLRKFSEQMVEILKLSAVQGLNAAMNPEVYKLRPSELKVGGRSTVAYPSVASVVASRLKGIDAQKVNSVRLALGRDAAITASIRSRGIDMRAEKAVREQLDVKGLFAFVNETTFGEAAMEKMAASLSVIPESNVPAVRDLLASDLKLIEERHGGILPREWMGELMERVGGRVVVLNKGVRFRVHEVKCIDETNPEWAGHDEIAWGGAAVDDKGTSSTIAERKVGGGFDDGDSKSYSPPEVLKVFPLDNSYPKEFLVVMTLAEKDSGGLSKFIKELYESIKAEITTILSALGAAAGAAIGGAIGGSVGTAIGGPLGTIIGTVAGAILGALVGWLVSILSDDIFPPQESAIFLASPNSTFPGGSLVSPSMEFHYRDHGGHYRVTYDWEITR